MHDKLTKEKLIKELTDELNIPLNVSRDIITALDKIYSKSALNGMSLRMFGLGTITMYKYTTDELQVYSPLHKKVVTRQRKFKVGFNESLKFQRIIKGKYSG